MIRQLIPTDWPAVQNVAESLPEWFNEDGRAMIERDKKYQFGFVAEKDSNVVGFLTYFVNQGIAHIGWMGILPGYQRQGLGTDIFKKLVDEMKRSSLSIIEVSTLGNSVDYPPYDRTRNFYYKMGFVEYERKLHDRESMPEELILRFTIEQKLFLK